VLSRGVQKIEICLDYELVRIVTKILYSRRRFSAINCAQSANNNNNNTLIYIAPACRMTSEALEKLSSFLKDIDDHGTNLILNYKVHTRLSLHDCIKNGGFKSYFTIASLCLVIGNRCGALCREDSIVHVLVSDRMDYCNSILIQHDVRQSTLTPVSAICCRTSHLSLRGRFDHVTDTVH